MIKVITTEAKAGLMIPITPDMVDNYDIIDGLSKTKETKVSITTPDSLVHEATIIYNQEECKYYIVFDSYTVMGKDSCINIDQNCTIPDYCGDGCANEEAVLTDETKIPVLDANGCPTEKFTTIGAIKKLIFGGGCVVADGLLETFPAGSRVVVVDSDCNLKGVSPNSLCCTDGSNPVDCNSCP